jgi:hypothetical protein
VNSRLCALLRRIVTGLVILCALVVAAAPETAAVDRQAGFVFRTAPHALTVTIARHDHAGLLCEHHDGLPCDCCFGDCSALVSILLAATSHGFMISRRIVPQPGTSSLPEGIGGLPDVPPPRSRV